MAGSSSDHHALTITIAGRRLTLHVNRKEEGAVQSMVREINDRYSDYQVKFKDRDELDCMVMTLLTYADELRTRPAPNTGAAETDAIKSRLTELNTLVEGML